MKIFKAGSYITRRQKRMVVYLFFFFLNDPPPTEIYTLPQHAALPICRPAPPAGTAHTDDPGRRSRPLALQQRARARANRLRRQAEFRRHLRRRRGLAESIDAEHVTVKAGIGPPEVAHARLDRQNRQRTRQHRRAIVSTLPIELSAVGH